MDYKLARIGKGKKYHIVENIVELFTCASGYSLCGIGGDIDTRNIYPIENMDGHDVCKSCMREYKNMEAYNGQAED